MRIRSSAAPREVRVGDYFVDGAQQFISTGCTVLDCRLAGARAPGGWALGRVVNLVGDTQVGKTLIAIETCANFHRQYPKGHIWYREAEGAFDVRYAERVGLPVGVVDFGSDGENSVWDTIDDISEDLDACLSKAEKSKQPGIYIIDSLDAVSSRAELSRRAGDGTYG